MPNPCDSVGNYGQALPGKSVGELLLLIGDEERGCKLEAMTKVLAMGLDLVYPDIEKAIRDDDDADARNGAMEVLVKFGARSVPRLIRLLADKNGEVRNFAAVMLGDIGSREAVVPLINALRDMDENVRHGAAEALGRIGDRAALVPILELLREDFWQQFPAVVALGEMRDNRAVPYLLQLLSHEMLREPVIEALGKIGDPRALNPLVDIIGDPSAEHCALAASALVAIHTALSEEYRYRNRLAEYDECTPIAHTISRQGVQNLTQLLRMEGNPATVGSAVSLLGWRGDASVIPEFISLLDRDEYVDVVESAILSIGKPVIPLLREALSHHAENVRIVALRTLRWLGGIDDPADLLPLLGETAETVRLETLEALKGTTSAGLLPVLREMLESGTDTVRARVSEVLTHYPLDRIRPILECLMVDSAPELRKYGAMIIGRMEEGSAVLLEPLLRDASDIVRREAVIAAGHRKFREALPLIREALTDGAIDVREAAVHALAEFGDPALLQDIMGCLGRDSERLDYAVVKGVGELGCGEAGPLLVDYLERGGIPRLLEFAVLETLGRLPLEARGDLQVLLGYVHHADPDIRRLAVSTLVRIADIDALPHVHSACDDPCWSVRVDAVHALGRIGGDRVLPALLKALGDQDAMVRKNALMVLGDMRNVRGIPALVSQLTDVEMSRHAFEALLKYGRTGLPWLHRVLRGDYAVDVKERVIDLVGKIGDRKSVEPLLEMLDDANPSIRMAAIDSLVFCIDSVPLKKLVQTGRYDADAEVRSKAELALKTLTMEKFY